MQEKELETKLGVPNAKHVTLVDVLMLKYGRK